MMIGYKRETNIQKTAVILTKSLKQDRLFLP